MCQTSLKSFSDNFSINKFPQRPLQRLQFGFLQIFDISSFALGPNFAPRCPISDSSVSFGIYRPTPSILGHSPRVSSILWSRRPILERFSPIFKGKRRRKRRVGQTGHCSQRRLCWGHTMEAQATRTGAGPVRARHTPQSKATLKSRWKRRLQFSGRHLLREEAEGGQNSGKLINHLESIPKAAPLCLGAL